MKVTDPDAKLSRSALLPGAFALFFLSFVMSGNGNAVPQLFFQRYYAEQKTLLLAAGLLASTAAGTLAVVLSRRARSARTATAFLMLGTLCGLVALLTLREAALFIAALVLVQFAANYLTHQIDCTAVERAGSLRRFNDTACMIGRLCGMLSAPAFFTAVFDKKALALVSVLTAGFLAAWGAVHLLRVRPVAHTTGADPAAGTQTADRADRLLFIYAVSVYVSLYLFAANMIYLLRDLLHIPHPETRGGTAIVFVFVSALLSNALLAALRGRSAEQNRRTIPAGMLAIPAVALTAFGGAIALGFRPEFLIFSVGSAIVGAAYGAFLWELRDYCTQAARRHGKSVLLSWFNNMANVSSLIAFCLMLAFAATRAKSPDSYFVLVMWAVAALPAAGLGSLAGSAALARRSA